MTTPLHLAPVGRLTVALCSLALVLAVTACDPGPTADAPSSSDAMPATSAGSVGSDDAQESPKAASGAFIVLPGTGRYAIGTEAPLGGYQLHGEPDEQPAGCTWSIEDADGVAAFENQGQYVFLTDIKEAVTFVTDGCPEWEQFE